MNLVKISELFEVHPGDNLALNALDIDPDGINFVSRTANNNGVSAKVKMIDDLEPTEAGVLTVAVGGSVLETFLQPQPFYSGRDLYLLRPKEDMSVEQKLFFCVCIRANKFRYNYGRQANKTLKDLLIPALSDCPRFIDNIDYSHIKRSGQAFSEKIIPFPSTNNWRVFQYKDIFDVKKGKRLTKSDSRPGHTPYVGAIDRNNGISGHIGQHPICDGNTITVSYSGSIAEAFYQEKPHWASDNVNVLYPKFELNPHIAMFVICLLKKEKYRFNYGRTWHKSRMEKSEIKLPVDNAGNPDWQFMEDYIKSLPFSSSI